LGLFSWYSLDKVTMLLRGARIEDVPQIMALERLTGYRMLVGSSSEEEHLQYLGCPDVRCFIAEQNANEVAGFAIICGLASEHRSLELKRIVVRVPGRGLGRQVLRLLLKKAFEEYGAHRLWLDVFENNLRAQRLYSSFGFRREGILREAVYRDGEYYSLILMSLLDREYDREVREKWGRA
jgi:diamine N-acetyltransferase